jgi:hypothetical protein
MLLERSKDTARSGLFIKFSVNDVEEDNIDKLWLHSNPSFTKVIIALELNLKLVKLASRTNHSISYPFKISLL